MSILDAIFKNNVSNPLAVGIDDSQTTITVADGSIFSVPSGKYIIATITETNSLLVETTEIIKIESQSGNDLTVVRGYEGTTPKTFTSSAKVEIRITAGFLSGLIELLTPIIPWETANLSSLSYSGISQALAGLSATDLRCLQFSPDGTKFFVFNINSGIIYRFSLSTAWDITTAVQDMTVSAATLGLGSTTIRAFCLSTDGNYLYVLHMAFPNITIKRYSLSSAFGISSASSQTTSVLLTSRDFSNSTQIQISSDGLTIMVADPLYQRIYTVPLSVAFAVTSIANSAFVYLSSAIAGQKHAIFSDDGAHVLWPSQTAGNYTTRRFNLGTAWDSSTGSVSDSVTSPAEVQSHVGIYAKDNLIFYLVGNTVYRCNL